MEEDSFLFPREAVNDGDVGQWVESRSRLTRLR
jgi:hypothetical protein